MSDGSILPPGSAGGEGQMPYSDFDEDGGGDNRRLLMLGGGAALVVVLLIAYLVLKGGGGGSGVDDATAVIPHGTPQSAVTPSPTESTGGTDGKGNDGGPSVGGKLPKKSHTKIARDPFKALFSADLGGGVGEPVSTTTVEPGTSTDPGTGETPAPGSTGTPGTVVIPTSPSEGGTPTSGPVTHGNPIWVELVATHGVKEAVFNVGYQNHKFRRFVVAAPAAGSPTGTIFDNEFALLSIQGNEVTIQVGDDTPFDLRKGVAHQLI